MVIMKTNKELSDLQENPLIQTRFLRVSKAFCDLLVREVFRSVPSWWLGNDGSMCRKLLVVSKLRARMTFQTVNRLCSCLARALRIPSKSYYVRLEPK